jgi:hypothetical protein
MRGSRLLINDPTATHIDGYRVGAAAAFVTVSEEPPAYASIERCSTLASSGRRRSLLVARRAVRCRSQIWHVAFALLVH